MPEIHFFKQFTHSSKYTKLVQKLVSSRRQGMRTGRRRRREKRMRNGLEEDMSDIWMS